MSFAWDVHCIVYTVSASTAMPSHWYVPCVCDQQYSSFCINLVCCAHRPAIVCTVHALNVVSPSVGGTPLMEAGLAPNHKAVLIES